MRIKQKDELLEITTEVYQAKNGGIFMNWGNTLIKLEYGDAEIIADDIPNIDRDAFVRHYKLNNK